MDVTARLEQVLARVADAAHAAGRSSDDVDVMLAVKTQTVDAIAHATRALAMARPETVVSLGHNRVNEMIDTVPPLRDSDLPVFAMHLIGPLQSNKIGKALDYATAIDTIDSLRLATKLSQACERRTMTQPLPVLVQVNVSGEQSKSGLSPDEAVDVACQIASLPHLRLDGLMTVGLHSDAETLVRAGYATLRELACTIVATGQAGTSTCRTLSMGMTQDLEWAIAEGATQVRVGTAVFGPRQ